MQSICASRGISRIDISHRLGMPKMTVSNIVSELIRTGLVVESDPLLQKRVGRNPIKLEVAPEAPLILGVWVKREALQAVLCDLRLKTLGLEREALPERRLDFEGALFRLIDRFAPALPRVCAVGVSALGPVDVDRQAILNPPDFYGLEDVPVGEMIARRYKKRVFFENDANCAALVERLYGQGRACDYFLELSLTNGIGSGIVSKGALYQDDTGRAGEFGHVSINYHGPRCSCGNRGCLEMYASTPVVLRRLRRATGLDLDYESFCALRDGAAEEVLLDVLDKVACALVGQVNMLNPQCVVVCNEGAYLRDDHLRYLEERINAGKLSKQHGHVRVLRSAFGAQASLFGSVGVALSRLFAL